MKTFTQQCLEALDDFVQNEHHGNAAAASRALGLDPSSGKLKKWLRLLDSLRSGSQQGDKLSYPTLDGIGECMDRIGARVETNRGTSSTISNRIGVSIGSTVHNSITNVEQQLREKDVQIKTLKEIIRMLGGAH